MLGILYWLFALGSMAVDNVGNDIYKNENREKVKDREFRLYYDRKGRMYWDGEQVFHSFEYYGTDHHDVIKTAI